MTIATNDYAGLRYFIDWFYDPSLDWEEIQGLVEGTVSGFIAGAKPATISEATADLDRLLDSNEDAPSIFDWFVRIGRGSVVNPENPREQLSQFRDLLRKAIE